MPADRNEPKPDSEKNAGANPNGKPRPRIVVVGSANMDLVVRVAHIPAPGETVLGGAFAAVPGGKGANQAVAAARLGAEVWFVGRVGDDAFGTALRAELQAAGIHTDYVMSEPDTASGVALIGVADSGQNAIIVAPGANGLVRPGDIEAARATIADADAVIVQLEIPRAAVAHAIGLAKSLGVRVLLNPAPVSLDDPLPPELLALADVVTPNESEAASLLGFAAPETLDMTQAARELRARGVANVVITLGGAGCLAANGAGVTHMAAPLVQAVDTTAAGDCFTGALAVGLAEGRSLEAAAQFAIRAASLSVTRAGAQPSLPTRAEVDALHRGE